MLPKREWMEMSWQDFRHDDVARWIAVLPLAAIEQHGPHLPVGVDTFIAQAHLARVRDLLPAELPASFLPVQAIGHSEEHTDFPGTLSLSAATFAGLLLDIGDSIARTGVRKLVLINSHGGNWPSLEIAARTLRRRWRMLAVTAAWHRFADPAAFPAAETLHGLHAGAIETAIMRATRPDLVDMSQAADFPSAGQELEAEFRWLQVARPAGFGWMAQDLNPAGAVGNAAAATADAGRAALDVAARGFVELLAEVNRFDLARLPEGPAG